MYIIFTITQVFYYQEIFTMSADLIFESIMILIYMHETIHEKDSLKNKHSEMQSFYEHGNLQNMIFYEKFGQV